MARFPGRVLEPDPEVIFHGATLAAALLLWLPALLAVFGGFNLVGRGGTMWRVLTPFSVLLVAVAPLTVPDSTSTQAVELLWGVASLVSHSCLGWGCWSSAVMCPSGAFLLGEAHWRAPRGPLCMVDRVMDPTFVDDVTLWSRFVVVLLAATASISAVLFVLHRFYVPRRRSRSWPMSAGAIGASGLLALRGVDGSIGALVVAEVAGLFLARALLSCCACW